MSTAIEIVLALLYLLTTYVVARLLARRASSWPPA